MRCANCGDMPLLPKLYITSVSAFGSSNELLVEYVNEDEKFCSSACAEETARGRIASGEVYEGPATFEIRVGSGGIFSDDWDRSTPSNDPDNYKE